MPPLPAPEFRPAFRPRTPTPEQPVRVAVVGTGGWGEQHARVFADRTDTELVGVVGRDVTRARARADAYRTDAYTDVDAMLDTAQPDLVTVCLPNEEHFAPTLHLIERGVPLLVEKPLVFDLTEADALLDAAAERDLFVAIDLNHRYAEPVQRLKAAIDAGDLGALVFATWRFGGEPNLGGSRHANLIETQVHGLDMLEQLCGPIASVMAQPFDGTHPGTVTTLAVALEFASGAVGTLLGTYDSSYAYPGTHLLEVNGTEGRGLVEDTVRRLTLSRAGDDVARVWQAGYFDDEARDFHGTFDRYVDDLLRALRAGGPPPVPAEAGRRALQVAHAIIRSGDEGVRVTVGTASQA
ncbi:Gfo/Idh/MocA family oxidoreductase [Isoptericola sp. b441]|uniref:Gfo/Idh/MocA family oxidoreductase n=1 Tax=Actinotalea lenta TaxID=3064654 RepID=A0ABT9DAR9_9CELL|nr:MULTISPECIES: Gfo/Idh/MocA family oxidoreductase [unclassified Isoptericola]MDO8107601.1 Gfo/Idh/MocA family oxidoreductase [Isoptericola sp. b441]MDO8120739.1 Gfo/Idh/MocA family oxidoreductase [Isoptericola sp. b490]